MTDAVISASGLCMAYSMYAKPTDILREALFGGVRHDTFWALRDVSFQVHEKQRLGIIGPNGAGKSTLLQIVAGNLKPTGGSLKVRGRISSLLSMTPAWSGEDSGIENIRFNLLMQGVDPAQIGRLTEDIIDFTELGTFIYQPVRTYSSGMSARLSFAIATAVQPEILIIDEVLATGDAYFVGKAYQRMTEFCDQGRALLFVSHATDAVRRLCDSVIWLQNGSIRESGPAEQVLTHYEIDYRKREDELLRSGNAAVSSARRTGVTLDELSATTMLRLRLVPERGGRLADTHYVRKITLDGIRPDTVEVPLEFADVTRDDVAAALDVLTSEWGRLFDRRGCACRVLSQFSGRTAGGHFLARPPSSIADQTIEVTVEAASEAGREQLAVEMLELGHTGAWEVLDPIRRQPLGDGWVRLVARGRLVAPRESVVRRLAEHAALLGRPKAEIVDAWTETDGQRIAVLLERRPFACCVRIRVNELLPLVDVGIKFTRTDGTYVFWQSSGLSPDGNLHDCEGDYLIRFDFDENLFGASEYAVTVYIASGWDYETNYPYSEVYCREVNATKFIIKPELAALDFGLVNQRARVQVRRPEDYKLAHLAASHITS